MCMLCSYSPSCRYEHFQFQSDCVRVCVWRFLVVFVFCSCVLCAFNVALEVVFTFRVVCLFACLFACLFVRAFACQAASMYASLFVRCLFSHIGFRFVFASCCRVRLSFVFVVALFGSSLSLMGLATPWTFKQNAPDCVEPSQRGI